jgi:hypothetical protein
MLYRPKNGWYAVHMFYVAKFDIAWPGAAGRAALSIYRCYARQKYYGLGSRLLQPAFLRCRDAKN